jgi:predicted nucleic acid-binding protein
VAKPSKSPAIRWAAGWALHARCDTLWSEDMQPSMTLDEGLRIVNPFRVAR